VLASQCPLGFNAGDANLYRYVGNTPINLTDPSGLQPSVHRPSRPSLWRWDWPEVSTNGNTFARGWSFGEDELLYFQRGCVGLCAIRTGSYMYRKDPMSAPGVRCFSNLPDALAAQKELNEKSKEEKKTLNVTVLFAIESENAIKCKYLDEEKKGVDPSSLNPLDLVPYDFATAFQMADGTIVYWERMPYGISKNPDLIVNRTSGHTYENVVYCVVVTDGKFPPHTVAPDDSTWRKGGKPRR
jgi:hypothetical protein